MSKHRDPRKSVLEIRAQLASSERKLLFLFGAGVSMSVGLPSLLSLTKQVEESLEGEDKRSFSSVKQSLGPNSNIEQILDRIRLIRELIGNNKDSSYDGLKGPTAGKKLDQAICTSIYKLVDVETSKLKPFLTLSYWLRLISRRRPQPIEIFSLNYDLLVERALESIGVPFFDGFVGSELPFFLGEAVEDGSREDERQISPPPTWVRLWKLHGSVNWFCGPDARLFRSNSKDHSERNDLMIFPSRDKYSESRKQPFMAFQDRFRRQLCRGETLLTVLGYSFSDQHINEIVRYAMKTNSRLSVNVFTYGDGEASGQRVIPSSLIKLAEEYRNCTIYGPNGLVIGGEFLEWKFDESPDNAHDREIFWDSENEQFVLGDFAKFGEFINSFMKLELKLPEDVQILKTSGTLP